MMNTYKLDLPLSRTYFHGSKVFEQLKFYYSWLVGCFGFNGPLRQYFSLYRAASQSGGERKRKYRREKNVRPAPAPTASTLGPCPTLIQISRTPRHWKFTQHLRATRPPQVIITTYNIGIKHCFSCINVCQVPTEVLKTEAETFARSRGRC